MRHGITSDALYTGFITFCCHEWEWHTFYCEPWHLRYRLITGYFWYIKLMGCIANMAGYYYRKCMRVEDWLYFHSWSDDCVYQLSDLAEPRWAKFWCGCCHPSHSQIFIVFCKIITAHVEIRVCSSSFIQLCPALNCCRRSLIDLTTCRAA